MKNFLLSSFLIFLFGNLCLFGLPWWSIAPIAFLVVMLLPQSGWNAFAAGLMGGILLWGIHAVLLNTANNGMFSAKIGQIFHGLSGVHLLYVTALMGGLLGGFGALTGQMAAELRTKPKGRDYYKRRRRSGRYR